MRLTMGIIPAHAGLTAISSGRHELFADHPRACGAHLNRTRDGLGRLGSSPRMRGSH